MKNIVFCFAIMMVASCNQIGSPSSFDKPDLASTKEGDVNCFPDRMTLNSVISSSSAGLSSENKRYTYITGTHRWSPGSRQLKLIDKTKIEIDYKNLAVSAGVLIIEGIKIFTDKNSTANSFPKTVKSATKNAAIAKAASDFVKSFELKKPKTQVAGSAYAYTQDGSGYCGMIMYRQRF